jgi:hypothetical protein
LASAAKLEVEQFRFWALALSEHKQFARLPLSLKKQKPLRPQLSLSRQ